MQIKMLFYVNKFARLQKECEKIGEIRNRFQICEIDHTKVLFFNKINARFNNYYTLNGQIGHFYLYNGHCVYFVTVFL